MMVNIFSDIILYFAFFLFVCLFFVCLFVCLFVYKTIIIKFKKKSIMKNMKNFNNETQTEGCARNAILVKKKK